VIGGLAAVYFVLPAHGAFLGGLPLGPAATVCVALVAITVACFGRLAVPAWSSAIATPALIVLIAARVAIAAVAVPAGWSGAYFSNATLAGEPEWSSDFRMHGSTRIDGAIDFHDDTFPAFYLNDYEFDRGSRREVTEPMSVEWRGAFVAASSQRLRLALTARGDMSVLVDGRPVAAIAASTVVQRAAADVALAPGPHAVTVQYVKPPDTDGRVALAATTIDASGRAAPLRVWPQSLSNSEPPSWPAAAGRALDAAVLAVWLFALIAAVRAAPPTRSSAAAAVTLIALSLQGIWQARQFAGRVLTLSQGDDWFGFESRARDVLHHGPMMMLGEPTGQGHAYFYHPLYCYFLAVVHALTGESLFGPVFLQFVILGVVAVLMWRFAADLFGDTAATIGAAALVALFELDFVRYYTVTLLSENIYILTVTMTLAHFARWVRGGRRRDVVLMAVWGGISSMTRPAMMMFFVPAVALVALLALLRTRTITAAAAAAALAAVVWLGTISPATVRNWVASHRLVLVSEGFAGGFIAYNLPASADANAYSDLTAGPVKSLLMLASLAIRFPREFFAIQLHKIGFSLGMVHWAGGYRPHPELVAVTVLYVLMLVAAPTMRARELWPVHAFVVAHVISMGLTLPWNYGYRLILPPFVYTTCFSAAAAWQTFARRARGLRAPSRSIATGA